MTDMDTGARGWMINFAKANFWRVAAWYEFDDLVQDGFMCWEFVVDHYERKSGRIRRRAHLMAAFKTAFINYIHGLAKRRTRSVDAVMVCDLSPDCALLPEDTVWDGVLQIEDTLDHARLVSEAPPLLHAILTKLDAGRLCALRSLYRVFSDGSRETLNDRLCRLAGVDPGAFDLATQLRAYLKIA